MAWLESHRDEIEAGKLVVFLLDECHLLWGDVCGYVWGKTNERIEVPIVSDRQRQTYFGALNYCSKQFLVKAYPTANSQNTIDFLKYLQSLYSEQRIAVFWDGASYHRCLGTQKLPSNRQPRPQRGHLGNYLHSLCPQCSRAESGGRHLVTGKTLDSGMLPSVQVFYCCQIPV